MMVPIRIAALILAALIFSVPAFSGPGPRNQVSALNVLPRVAGWAYAEEPKRYGPDTLFEYIDGAAEAFLSYDFAELALGQYKAAGGAATMTVEVYDMKEARNAFGIYAGERFSESTFLPIGVQGYIEEGALNFLAGRFYVKMLAYEAGAGTAAVLRAFAAEVLKAIGDPGAWPEILKVFPRQALTANTEKFILKNFLGQEFLSHGWTASYKLADSDADGFIVECGSAEDAAALLTRYLGFQTSKGLAVEAKAGLWHWKDPYLARVFVGRSGRFLYGVTKAKDTALDPAEKLALALGAGLSGR